MQAMDFSGLPDGKQINLNGNIVTPQGINIPSGKYTISHSQGNTELVSSTGQRVNVGVSSTSNHWDNAANPLSPGFWDNPAAAVEKGGL